MLMLLLLLLLLPAVTVCIFVFIAAFAVNEVHFLVRYRRRHHHHQENVLFTWSGISTLLFSPRSRACL